MRKPYAVLALLAVLACILLAGFFKEIGHSNSRQQFELIPLPRIKTDQMPSEAATGWSTLDDSRLAIREAITRAKAKLSNPNPTYAFVIYTIAHDPSVIQTALKEQLGKKIKIHGLSSSVGVITNEGLHKGNVGSVAILLSSTPTVTFGVGSLNMAGREDYEQLGRETILKAIRDAGKDPSAPPDVIFFSGTFLVGDENKILAGIADIVGKDTPVFGGNGGDETMEGRWSQITRETVYTNGLVLTAVYTNRKVGWGFESDFNLLDKGGIVTKARKNIIYEIDGKPALDVYNEWRGGDLYDEILSGDVNSLLRYTAQYPLARIMKGPGGTIAYCGLHPFPKAENIKDKSLPLGTAVHEGDEIRMFSGTWQIVLNRAERIPLKALAYGGIKPGQGLFGVITLCTGLALSLPPEELAKIPILTSAVVKNIPFIGMITHGEEGMLPGIGNINANLVESMVIIGKEKD